MGYKAALVGALDHPDVPVFPLVAVGHLGLHLPSQGVADSHRDAVSLLDVGHDAVRRACLDTEDAIPERHRGLLGRMDVGVGKWAGREPRLADAVLARLVLAWTAFPEIPAWAVLVERWALLRAEAALCIPAEAPFAA